MKKLFMAFFVLLGLTMTASSQRGATTINDVLNESWIPTFDPWDFCNYEDASVGLQYGYDIEVKDKSDRVSRVTICFLGRPNKRFVDYVSVSMSERSSYMQELGNTLSLVGHLLRNCFNANTDKKMQDWVGSKLETGQTGTFRTFFGNVGLRIIVKHYKNLNRGEATIDFWREDSPATASWAKYCVFN